MEGGDFRMSSSIDERVVSMKFDDVQFQQGIKTTLDALDQLNKGLKLEGATKGLNDVSTAAKGITLSNIGDNVASIADKFKTFSVVAITALANIATQAISTGAQFVKSLTLTPLQEGLSNYETQINSIQTILANTSQFGTKLSDVTTVLGKLNDYANQTIFSFADMAHNIGTFTAAGVDLKTSEQAIKGIANLAALSGSNTEQAATAMYQLSQAIAAGKVGLQDWNSVVNAGIGGHAFQEALFNTAKVMGTIKDVPLSETFDQWTKKGNSFRNSLQDGWITAGVLTQTLSQFTGDVTDQQLKSLGYTQQQITQIQAMAQTAKGAATELKTFSALTAALHDESATAWASSFKIIIGSIDQAKEVFTGLDSVIGGYIMSSAAARNAVLSDWAALGGRTAIIQSVVNVFHALIAVLTPIKEAFRDIFPPTTGKQLADLSFALERFTAKLVIGKETASDLKRIFEGVFSVLGIVKDVVVDAVKTFADLFGMVNTGGGSFLSTAAKVGDFLTNLKKSVEAGQGIKKFFQDFETVVLAVVTAFQALGEEIKKGFGQVDNVATPAIDRIQARLSTFGQIGKNVEDAWNAIVKAYDAVVRAVTPAVHAVENFFHQLDQAFKDTFGGNGIDFHGFLDAINTGLIGGLVLIFKKFLDGVKNSGFSGKLFDAIKEPLEQLTGVLKAMQTQLKADALEKIAIAIALLTVSVVALSLVNSDKLTVAVTALGVMFGELAATLDILTKMTKSEGIIKLPLMMASLFLLAGAIDLLVISVVALSKLDWNGLAKGLTGLAVILGVLVGYMQLMPDNAKMISMGIGLIVFAAGVKILASAVTDMASLSWEEMARGLVGVGAVLTALLLFSKFSEVGQKKNLFTDTGLLVMALAINLLANAVTQFAKNSWEDLAKGLLVIGASLNIIGLAIDKMPKDAVVKGLAILAVAGAMDILAQAIKSMGGMSWTEIGKGLLVMAGALIIMVAAVEGMEAGLPGAAAILVLVASLALLVPVLKAMGDLSWTEIGKSMLVLAGVFVIFGVAAALLTPVVPVMVLMGAAVALLGVGMLAAGAGVFLFSLALTALAAAGAAGTAAIVFMIEQLASLIPAVMTQLGLGIIAFAQTIAGGGAAFTAAFTTILLSLINAVTDTTPKIVEALFSMLQKLLQVLLDHEPKMVDMGLKLLIGLLHGIANNIGQVVTTATDVVVNFINAIGASGLRITQAGINMIINFMNGLASQIRGSSDAMHAAAWNLASAIIDGMTGGLFSGVGKVISAAKNVAQSALDAALHLLGIHSPSVEFMKIGRFSAEGMAVGLDAYAHVVSNSASGLGQAALDSLRTSISGLSNVVSGEMNLQPIITPVLDLTDLKKNAGQIDKVLAGTKTLSTDISLTQAVNAAADVQANTNDLAGVRATNNTYNFNQTNNSPKALSEADIYRQTKNQLSVVTKGVPGANSN
jgi:tape measure domain-containing protein